MDAILAQLEHGALGDVDDLLALNTGLWPGKGDLVNSRDKLGDPAVRGDPQGSVACLHPRAPGIESAAEHHLARILRDIDEAAGPDRIAGKFGHIDIADGVQLAKSEKGDVQPAARIEVELRGAVDHAAGIHGVAEQITIHQPAAIGAMFDCLEIAVRMAVTVDQLGNLVGDTKAEIDHGIVMKFLLRTAGDHQPLRENRLLRVGAVATILTGQRRVIDNVIALPLGLVDDNSIDKRRRDAHLAGLQAVSGYLPANLENNLAAAVMRRRRQGIDIEVGGLFLKRDVAILVGITATKQRHRHRDRQIAEVVTAINGNDLGQLLCRRLVHAAAIQPRINKGAKPDMGDQPRPAGGDLAH